MSYVFDPEELHRIVRGIAGMAPGEAMFDRLTADLDAAYPGRIETGERIWLFNNAGGAMGQLVLLHASLGEYLLLFGSPIGTEGHSGRYRTDVWDFMLSGEMWTYLEGHVERQVYGPGDAAFLGEDQAKGYRLPDGGFMLEYARGPIPTMMPFGLADSLFSTLDLKTVGRTLRVYGQQVMKSFRAERVHGRGASRSEGVRSASERPEARAGAR